MTEPELEDGAAAGMTAVDVKRDDQRRAHRWDRVVIRVVVICAVALALMAWKGWL